MIHYYAFNGDADGLCALQQLRLEDTDTAVLVTGVKRDIKLLQHVPASEGDRVTVLDISLDQNRDDLRRLLDAGAAVRYFDHHYAGDMPQHAHFTPVIDESAGVCTSILVDRHLAGRHHAWAIVAAYGDNLSDVADTMAQRAGIPRNTASIMQMLGTCLNYNAYGETLADLHVDPAELAQQMKCFADPLEFAACAETYARIKTGYEADMAMAQQLAPARQCTDASLLILPDAAWARRVVGVLANEQMRARPDHALAILSPKAGGGFIVSVRVPAHSAISAAEFCRTFETGGGRKLAGGINHLPQSGVDDFIDRFDACFDCS